MKCASCGYDRMNDTFVAGRGHLVYCDERADGEVRGFKPCWSHVNGVKEVAWTVPTARWMMFPE